MKTKRSKGGLILRLVDICLILLFGFLMIAKIQMQVEIPLPQSGGKNDAPQEDPEICNVWIYKNGRIAGGKRRPTPLVDMPLRNQDPAGAQLAYAQLVEHVRGICNRDETLIIYSEYDAPVQYTVEMLDVCKELGLKKSIRCLEAPGE